MPVVLRLKFGDAVLRTCSSRCHFATTGSCNCVCGGSFHGIGRQPAWDDVHDGMLEDLRPNDSEFVRVVFGELAVGGPTFSFMSAPLLC